MADGPPGGRAERQDVRARLPAPRRVAVAGRLLALGLILGGAIPGDVAHAEDGQAPLEIAVLAPMSGEGAATGQAIARGALRAVAEVNAQGGIGGRGLSVRFYDDENDPARAAARAEEAVGGRSPLAVIGHWYSECSVAAGPVYLKHRVPAVTPGSMILEVTRGNPWYFSLVYSARFEAEVLAHYLHRVLLRDDVVVLSEAAAYGEQLEAAFVATAERIGLRVRRGAAFDGGGVDARAIERIKAEVRDARGKSTIVLAMRAELAATVVRALRDAGVESMIVGPSSLSEAPFLEVLSKAPAERLQPGYYSNGIYALTPLLYSTTGASGQAFREAFLAEFGEEPTWVAGYSYDAIRVIAEAARAAGLEGLGLEAQRARLRAQLETMDTAARGVEGVTGLTFFDGERFARRPPMMAVFRGRLLVPAMTQLQATQRPYAIGDEINAPPPSRAFAIDDLYLATTDVAFAGAKVSSISEISTADQSFTLDILLWFRHASDVDLDDLVFPNAIGDVERTPVEVVDEAPIRYRLYRVRGRFRAESLSHAKVLEEIVLSVRLRHRTAARRALILAPDPVALSASGDDGRAAGREGLVEALNPSSGFRPTRLLVRELARRASGYGAPTAGPPVVGGELFSELEVSIVVARLNPSLIGLLPEAWAPGLLVAGLLMSIAGLLVRARRREGPLSYPGLALLVLGALVGLLSAEVMISHAVLGNEALERWLPTFGKVFDVLWWIAPALLLNATVSTFLWDPIERRTGHPVPTMVRRATLFVLLLFTVFGILAFVFDQKITSLLATSGVAAMIVGFAIQVNISNIVSGLILNMEKPFKIGDWVQIQDQIGQVVDINWRATRLRTFLDNIVSIPNAKVAELVVVNYHYPTDSGWFGFSLHIEPEHPPEDVKAVIGAALMRVPDVLEPWVTAASLTEWSAEYGVYYRMRDYGTSVIMKDRVVRALWAALGEAGIKLALRKQEVHLSRDPSRPG